MSARANTSSALAYIDTSTKTSVSGGPIICNSCLPLPCSVHCCNYMYEFGNKPVFIVIVIVIVIVIHPKSPETHLTAPSPQ